MISYSLFETKQLKWEKKAILYRKFSQAKSVSLLDIMKPKQSKATQTIAQHTYWVVNLSRAQLLQNTSQNQVNQQHDTCNVMQSLETWILNQNIYLCAKRQTFNAAKAIMRDSCNAMEYDEQSKTSWLKYLYVKIECDDPLCALFFSLPHVHTLTLLNDNRTRWFVI